MKRSVAQPRRSTRQLGVVWLDSISSMLLLFLLLLSLLIGTGEMIHGQLLRIGERLYADPSIGMQYSYLRVQPTAPQCPLHQDLEAEIHRQMQHNAKDEFADFFGVTTEADLRRSVLAAQQLCIEKHAFYQQAQQYLDQHPSIAPYRGFETGFFAVFKFGTDNRILILVLMLLLCTLTATLKMHHINFRPAQTQRDLQLYHALMCVGNALVSYSVGKQYASVLNSGVLISFETHAVYVLWLLLFASLSLISAYRWLHIPKHVVRGGSLGLALLCVPLFAWMAIVSGIAFILLMDYPMGQGIYLGQLIEFSGIFLNLALFIWAGMLLTQTRLLPLCLGVLRPWNLAPEVLTFLILIAAAIPTAYTGASGIFVIAAGALIYREVLAAGARSQYALAVSAMSGSLGVVLRPCLLMILISMLDSRHVTSDELFDHGIYVFYLSATIFLLFSLCLAEPGSRQRRVSEAVPNMLRALGRLIPYAVIMLGVLGIYRYVLNTQMDEFTAPMILPLMLLGLIGFDRFVIDRKGHDPSLYPSMLQDHKHAARMEALPDHAAPQVRTFGGSIGFATAESVGHIGALMILMALSACMGGLIERSDVVSLLPLHLGNIWISLGVIALLLALVGMCTDPFGAVILVAASIAPVAYANGIHPIHFWMMVLLAFEFGYVTPPVALNHLLTRLSVGDAEVAAADAEAKQRYRHRSIYYRYERWILPMAVLLSALSLVTYLPYILNLFGWYD